jgi:hypothetical protein
MSSKVIMEAPLVSCEAPLVSCVERCVALGYVVRRSVCGTVYLGRRADRALGTGGLHVREVGLRADVALPVEVVEVHLVIVVVPARSYSTGR